MYVQHLPSEKFYQVVALSVEQYRFGKLWKPYSNTPLKRA
jgi:hypothetical protein